MDRLCPPEAKRKVEDLFGLPVVTRSANVSVADLYRVRNEIADRIAQLVANPSSCNQGGGGTCSCNGLGRRCSSPDLGWWWSGQHCNAAGDCVSNPCEP